MLKLYKAIIAALLIWLTAAASIVLFPAFFLFWSIYNRKEIKYWLSVLLLLLSTLIYYQLYIFFKSVAPSSDIMHNPAVYYGICLIAPFLLSRLSSLKPSLSTTKKYLISVLLSILLLASSLILVIAVHYLFYKRGIANNLFVAEGAIVLWVSLVVFLFIRYPDDALIKAMYRYGLLLFQWVNGKKDNLGI